MLIDASVRLIERGWPMTAVRAYADGANGPAESYRAAAAEVGWFGLLAREEHGGGSVSGNGLLDAALIAVERGARLQPSPFVGHSTAVAALSTTALSAHTSVLRGLVDGRAWATCALENGTSLEMTTVDSKGAWRVDGAIPILADADQCSWLVVATTSEAGTALVLVPADTAGISRQPIEGIDLTRRWCRLDFVDVHVDPEAILAEPGLATRPLIQHLRQIAATLQAAESVGAMHADLALAVQYARDRIAFGRPIGSFQAVKHLLADTSLSLELAKAVVAAAATALGTDALDGPRLSHAAKAFVSEHGIELAHNCFQVFGGIGFTWEHDQHLYLRRLAADAEQFGSQACHRKQLVEPAGVA
jgi:alkylation response protein AidB-like acyl-CoA dehydrogenase